MEPLKIDRDQARRFLSTLAVNETDARFVFQTFSDHKVKGQADPLARKVYGTFEEVVDYLDVMQTKGAGVFVQIQQGEQRGKDAITGSRALFVDADEPPVQDVITRLKTLLPKPHIVVKSSAGKMHLYWRTEQVTPDLVRPLLATLASVAGTDTNACTADRVLRLPGSWHQKNPDNKQMVQLLSAEHGVIDLDQFVATIKAAPKIVKDVVKTEEPTTDNPFGIYVSDYEEPTVLKPGTRTNKLVAHIGHLLSKGFSADHVRQEIIRLNETITEEGCEPIPLNVLEIEVLGAVTRFAPPPPAPPAPMPAVQSEGIMNPRAAEVATAPAAPEVVEDDEVDDEDETAADLNPLSPDPVHYLTRSYILANPNTQESWLARYVHLLEGNRVLDTLTNKIYRSEDLKAQAANKRAGEKSTLFTSWAGNVVRAEATRVLFLPEAPKIVRYDRNIDIDFNIYKPILCELTKKQFHVARIKPFIDHVNVLFSNQGEAEIFLDWIAFTFQKPATRCTWAPILQSEQGTGKTFITDVMQRMISTADPSYLTVVEPKVLERNFNGYLSQRLVVVFEEIHTRARFELADRLKTIINAETLEIEKKHVDAEPEKIYANIIAFTNWSDALVLSDDDRRFWVVNVDHEYARNQSYFAPLFKWSADPENIDHLRYYFCHERDVSKFNYGSCPDASEAKKEMIQASKSLVELAIEDMRDDGRRAFKADIMDKNAAITAVAQELNAEITPKFQADVTRTFNRMFPVAGRVVLDEARQQIRQIRRPRVWKDKCLTSKRREAERARKFNIDDSSQSPGVLRSVT